MILPNRDVLSALQVLFTILFLLVVINAQLAPLIIQPPNFVILLAALLDPITA